MHAIASGIRPYRLPRIGVEKAGETFLVMFLVRSVCRTVYINGLPAFIFAISRNSYTEDHGVEPARAARASRTQAWLRVFSTISTASTGPGTGPGTGSVRNYTLCNTIDTDADKLGADSNGPGSTWGRTHVVALGCTQIPRQANPLSTPYAQKLHDAAETPPMSDQPAPALGQVLSCHTGAIVIHQHARHDPCHDHISASRPM